MHGSEKRLLPVLYFSFVRVTMFIINKKYVFLCIYKVSCHIGLKLSMYCYVIFIYLMKLNKQIPSSTIYKKERIKIKSLFALQVSERR